MNFVDVAEAARQNQFKWALLPFYKDGAPFEGGKQNFLQGQKCSAMPKGAASPKSARPLWGMTLLAAGSMRFRWNETNPNRDQFLSALCDRYKKEAAVPLELIHSKIVYEAREAADTFQKQGDAIVTKNSALVPVVTVADCVPIYFYDSATGAFGAAHSGWKGTGIAASVVQMMKEKYGSNPRDILAAIGPHIHDCCYTVDEERAKYFCDNFGSDCVHEIGQDQEASLAHNGGGLNGLQDQKGGGQKYALSLLRANINVLTGAGVLEENIVAATNCTACDARFGSFRREAAALDVPDQDKSRLFTTQAAFVIIEERES